MDIKALEKRLLAEMPDFEQVIKRYCNLLADYESIKSDESQVSLKIRLSNQLCKLENTLGLNKMSNAAITRKEQIKQQGYRSKANLEEDAEIEKVKDFIYSNDFISSDDF